MAEDRVDVLAAFRERLEFVIADGCIGCRMHCPYMKMIDLVMLRDTLRRGKHEIAVPADVAAGARRALERMIAVPRMRD